MPNGIDRTQWAHFVTYRLKPETLVQVTLFWMVWIVCVDIFFLLCELTILFIHRRFVIKNRENHKKQVIPHTGGSKPMSRRRHEMVMIVVNMILYYFLIFTI